MKRPGFRDWSNRAARRPEPDYGTGVLNKRKKTVFTAWPDEDFSPSEVVDIGPVVEEPRYGSPLWRILLHVTDEHQVTTVGLDVWRVTVLGRSDPTGAYHPDVDFAPYSGMRLGVSRRHALIKPDVYNLWLIDQHSTNGTWVNGTRLKPGRQHRLEDGYRVELGDMKVLLRVMNSPVQLADDWL